MDLVRQMARIKRRLQAVERPVCIYYLPFSGTRAGPLLLLLVMRSEPFWAQNNGRMNWWARWFRVCSSSCFSLNLAKKAKRTSATNTAE